MQEVSYAAQLQIRHFRPAVDVPRLVRLFTEVEAVDREGEDTSEAALRYQLSRHGHDPIQDRWAVGSPYDPDTLIAYAALYIAPRGQPLLDVVVHPHWRRIGMGSRLLQRGLRRARKMGADHVVVNAKADSGAARHFLRQHGFQTSNSVWLLYAPDDILLEQPRWPAGFSVRRFAMVQQLPTLVEVLNRSYGDAAGYGRNGKLYSRESVKTLLATEWEPQDMFLAFSPDGEAAGFCQVRFAGKRDNPYSTDFIDAPGIVPAYRGRQLRRPLLLTAMQWQRRRGHGGTRMISWGDDEEALDVYRDVGFMLVKHYISYRYVL